MRPTQAAIDLSGLDSAVPEASRESAGAPTRPSVLLEPLGHFQVISVGIGVRQFDHRCEPAVGDIVTQGGSDLDSPNSSP